MMPMAELLETAQWQNARHMAHLRQAGLTKRPLTKLGVIEGAENDAAIGFLVFFKNLLHQRAVGGTYRRTYM